MRAPDVRSWCLFGCVAAIATATAITIVSVSAYVAASAPPAGTIRSETLLKTGAAWDGSAYPGYPDGRPELSVLRITLPGHTTMDWHSHPVPNVAYIVSGELTVEKRDGSAPLTRHFTAGQTIPELVNAAHRGVTGDQAVELIVFYAGTNGLPLAVRQAD